MEIMLLGDALEQLRTLESESVHTCVTSPPYYNLRDYEVSGQIGMENTPEEYIDRLVGVFREVRRILRSNGTLWLNIGDSYRNKNLLGIPWTLAFALRSDGWHLRQDIIWQKPDAMPESVKDRCTKSHEYIFLLSKSPRYYFDMDAIREPFTGKPRKGERRSYRAGAASSFDMADGHLEQRGNFAGLPLNPKGRSKRDVWTVSTGSSHAAHFATFPEKLVEPCILAGCPEGGVVLDPFAGSGTTGVVAKRLRRGFIGVEINAQYFETAQKRISAVVAEYEQLTMRG